MPRKPAPRKSPRRRQWDLALAYAQRQPHQVAKSWGVHKSTVNGVLAGKITSAPLLARIDAFIAKHLPNAAEAA